MITLIKLLILIFLILLGYDTINLFLENSHVFESREVSSIRHENDLFTKCFPFTKFTSSLEENVKILWVTCAGAVIVTAYLIKKWRTIEKKNNSDSLLNMIKVLEIGQQTSQLVNRVKLIWESDMIDQQLSLSSIENNLLEQDEEESPLVKDDKVKEKEENFVETVEDNETEEIALTNSNTTNASDESGCTVINKITPVYLLPEDHKNGMISNMDDIYECYIEKNMDQSYLFNNDTENISRMPFLTKESLKPIAFVVPEVRSIVRKCQNKINNFEERLGRVENNIKNTEEFRTIWKTRIEQTEEELLELQQQMHYMILDRSLSSKLVLRQKLCPPECQELLPSSSGAMKPFHFISRLIEETKKELEDESLAALKSGKSDPCLSVLSLPINMKISNTIFNNLSEETKQAFLQKEIPKISLLPVEEKIIADEKLQNEETDIKVFKENNHYEEKDESIVILDKISNSAADSSIVSSRKTKKQTKKKGTKKVEKERNHLNIRPLSSEANRKTISKLASIVQDANSRPASARQASLSEAIKVKENLPPTEGVCDSFGNIITATSKTTITRTFKIVETPKTPNSEDPDSYKTQMNYSGSAKILAGQVCVLDDTDADRRMELQYKNKQLKFRSIGIVKEIDDVFNNEPFGNNNARRRLCGYKDISPRVPSHIVRPKTQYTKVIRPPPRCAYSVKSQN